MKQTKGEPLRVQFTHVENDNVKKTIARCKVKPENVPYIVYNEFFDLFENKTGAFEWDSYVSIYAETVCKDGDSYDPKIGEKIARKKIMKKFMSMLQQAAKVKGKRLLNEAEEVLDFRKFAKDCEIDIIKYLRNQ